MDTTIRIAIASDDVRAAVADVLQGVVNDLRGNEPTDPTLDFAGEFSAPDEMGRVRWRFAEQLVAEFGAVIESEEMLVTGGSKKHRFPIPRYFHLRQTCGPSGSFSHWNAANASFVAPFNASRIVVPGTDPQIIPLTYSSWEPDLETEKRRLRQRCVNLRDGHTFAGFSGVSSDQDPGPAA